jgi:hypothetical protein
MLRQGSTGSAVEELQTFLAAQGYDVGAIDGRFGPRTAAAVRQFQKDQGLQVDGVVGPNTNEAIANIGQPEAEEEPEAEIDPETDGVVIEDDIITPEGAVEPVEGGEAGFPGIMAGGTIHRVQNPAGQQDFYIVSYEYPPDSGHEFFYRFDSIESLENAIGPNLGGGAVAVGPMLNEAVLGAWTDAGNSSEILGVEGSFDGYMDDLVAGLVAGAGGGDPTLVGAALQNPEIILIMAQTAEGSWTPAQTKAALRQTDYYKTVMYPGIENFYAQSDNPEGQYAVYAQNVIATAKSLGLPADADGSYKSVVGQLLDSGVSDVAFANFASPYKQAQRNIGFADALSKWTEQFAGVPIESFEDYFDILAGNAPADIQEIAEVAGLQFMADNAGFAISDEQLQLIGEAVDLDQEQAGRLFSKTARNLLALGERGLRRGELTAQDVLEAEAGFSSSGKDIEKIKLKMAALAREEGMSDDPTATIFTDFNREGAPVKRGLQSTISEGA